MLQYFLTVLALLLSECAGGVVAAIWPRCVGLQNAQGGAVGSLQAYYALPDYEHWTAAMDLAQTQVNNVEEPIFLPSAYPIAFCLRVGILLQIWKLHLLIYL